MPQDYTPDATVYGPYPVEIAATSDSMHKEFFNNKLEDIYQRIHFLKTKAFEEDTDLEAIVENINTNVGGDVAGTAAPDYDDTVIVVDGDSHHTAIEKLDEQVVSNNAKASTNEAQILGTQAHVSNMASKVGLAATQSPPFAYANENFIVSGESLKLIVEKIDRILLGIRRSNEFGYDKAYNAFIRSYINEGHNVLIYDFESFYDNAKYNNPLTTALISFEYQEASGDETYVVWQKTSAAPITHILFDWELSSGGAIEVRFHTNNELTWAAMEPYTVGKGNFQGALIQNTSLAIKVKITGTTRLYNFSYIAKGT